MRWRNALIAGLSVGLAAIAGWRFVASAPDPFGPIERVKPLVPRASLEMFLREDSMTAEAAIRSTAARGRFAGRERELSWFLQRLQSIPVPAAQIYQQQTDPEFSVILNCIAALGDGWDQAGPYPTRRDEVEAQMLRFSEHPVAGVRGWVGAVLVAMDRTGSLSDAGRKRLEELRGQEIVSMGIHNLSEYRLIRHRERAKSGDKP